MVNPNEKYFLESSSRKLGAVVCGLEKVSGTDCYVDKNGNRWKPAYLWEDLWGVASPGFVRFPEPKFGELWTLLTESEIEENMQGAAMRINEKYPEEMKHALIDFFKTGPEINGTIRKKFDLLELGTNRSQVIGKHWKEIEKDYEEWRFVKTEYERLTASTAPTSTSTSTPTSMWTAILDRAFFWRR